MSIRRLVSFPILAVMFAFAIAPAADAAPRYDRVCGLMPGDGAFGYVKAANTSCRHARKVTNRARKKFCRLRNNCMMRSDRTRYRGKVKRNGWRCKVTIGWELSLVRCHKGRMRVLSHSAA